MSVFDVAYVRENLLCYVISYGNENLLFLHYVIIIS